MPAFVSHPGLMCHREMAHLHSHIAFILACTQSPAGMGVGRACPLRQWHPSDKLTPVSRGRCALRAQPSGPGGSGRRSGGLLGSLHCLLDRGPLWHIDGLGGRRHPIGLKELAQRHRLARLEINRTRLGRCR